jgi:multicomponent Na+:H+ antiporter subunit A
LIWLMLSLFVVGVAVITVFGSHLGRRSLWVAALPMACTAAWSIGQLATSTTSAAGFDWVPDLGLSMVLRVDATGALLSTLVAGVGTLVCVYSIGYFSPTATGMKRFAATLLGFSGAMVGLVWADSVWTLFLFWELTTVTSFLLVGFKHTDPTARIAARRALFITAGGGLALLAGFVLLVDAAGTAVISELPAVSGSTATAAAILILCAAATKSAQVPFHVWLPGAMAAPTPVSAYLHSATMVKAGVILIAVVTPAFADTDVWRPLGLSFGIATMLWGAIGALRHVDAKLILAWGTVSQLGLLVTLLAIGSAKATFAAFAVLVAHAIFKAALFMVVGEVDVRAGTRNINELSGLRAAMPLTFAVAVVSAASMAGIPLVLGFPAKEAAIEAVLGLDGGEFWVVGGAVVVGAASTVAYTTRLLLGMFGRSGPGRPVAAARAPMSVAEAALATASVGGYLAVGVVAEVVRDAAVESNPAAAVYTLYRWPGLTDAFVISMTVVAVGVGVGVLAARRRVARGPQARGAANVDALIDAIGLVARRIAGRVQHGSLPLYLTTTIVVLSAGALAFVGALDADGLYWFDNRAEAGLVVIIVAAAISATAVRSRLGAALVLGSVGFAMSGLFVALGAPDLALTQLLVETVIVVGFVVGLGRLSTTFPAATRAWLLGRVAVSILIAGAIAIAMVASTSDPAGVAPTELLADSAVEEGGGKNVVNVILTDTRGLDTVGEVIVLLVVAVGILTLTRTRPARRAEVVAEVVG